MKYRITEYVRENNTKTYTVEYNHFLWFYTYLDRFGGQVYDVRIFFTEEEALQAISNHKKSKIVKKNVKIIY